MFRLDEEVSRDEPGVFFLLGPLSGRGCKPVCTGSDLDWSLRTPELWVQRSGVTFRVLSFLDEGHVDFVVGSLSLFHLLSLLPVVRSSVVSDLYLLLLSLRVFWVPSSFRRGRRWRRDRPSSVDRSSLGVFPLSVSRTFGPGRRRSEVGPCHTDVPRAERWLSNVLNA